MNYTLKDFTKAVGMITKENLNVTQKEWLMHLYQRWGELISDQEEVNFFNFNEKMLNGAKNWYHYVSTASADIVSDIDLLNRHFSYDQEKVNHWLEEVEDPNGKLLYSLTACDIMDAAKVLKYALEFQHQINKLK